MFLEVLLLVVLVYLVYLSLSKRLERFDESGFQYEYPLPLVGNLWRSLFKRCHMITDSQRIYHTFGDSRSKYVGLFNFLTPVIMLKDPEIIKNITVKDFDHFEERQSLLNEKIEPLFGRNLVTLKGQKWRDMRATLSPAFTSSKIRDVCPFVSEIGNQMTDYLSDSCGSTNDSGLRFVDVEMKEISTRYMNDVIATAAFGLKVNSFKDKDNEFYTMGRKLTMFTGWQQFKITLAMVSGKILELLKIRIFPEEINTFFRNIVLDTMKYRLENNVVRRDMIHLLMQAKKGQLKHEATVTKQDAGFATVEESDIGTRELKTVWTDDDLVAQAILFFFAGFETGATLMSFVFHELAVNPDVQKKLQDEVDENFKTYKENITYDALQNMPYVDMVISEGLRKWPPGPISDRICVKDINIGPVREAGEQSYTIKKSEMVWIPIYAIHYDPKYWEEPQKFEPERFSDENKSKITPFTYLPFGAGPRNCIGSRFALLEVKMMLYHIISKFQIEVCSKTTVPMELDKKTFRLQPKNGFWVRLVERTLNKNK